MSGNFDPLAHFEEHMAGAPGHCLTRSAILATQLLSVGIPARVVQLVPAQGRGHTLVSVWDDSSGWLVVDPTTSGFITWDGPRGSAPDLLTDPGRVEWTPMSSSWVSAAEKERVRRRFVMLLRGVVLYPEPWLYLRQGKRAAPWPLRGYYARVGPLILTLGPVQAALMCAVSGLLVLGLSLMTASWMKHRRYKGTLARLRTGVETSTYGVMPPA